MGTSLDELRAQPKGVKLLGEPMNMTIAESVAYTDGRIDCCPASFAPLLERAHHVFAELQARPADQLQLIQWRNRRQHNSWGRRIIPTLRRGEHARNPLFFHPDDLAAHGLAAGDDVVVRSDAGAVQTVAGIDDALRPGVVALSHGYGERSVDDPDDLEVGVNVNRLLPTGPGSYEHYSGMAFMQGIPVTVERA
jgi:formate dehydrogenase